MRRRCWKDDPRCGRQTFTRGCGGQGGDHKQRRGDHDLIGVHASRAVLANPKVDPGMRSLPVCAAGTAWHDEWEDTVASLAVQTDDGLV